LRLLITTASLRCQGKEAFHHEEHEGKKLNHKKTQSGKAATKDEPNRKQTGIRCYTRCPSYRRTPVSIRAFVTPGSFTETTVPHPHRTWIPASAGMTDGTSVTPSRIPETFVSSVVNEMNAAVPD
jgi:hypothetical protein